MKRKPAKVVLISLVVLIVAAGTVIFITNKRAVAPAPPQEQQKSSRQQEPTTPEAASIDSPDSLEVVVNKKRPLPDNYAPQDLDGNLRSETASASRNLLAAAKADGVSLKLISGYRSQATQANLYDSYVKKDGQAAADTYSARPRHSEHQTGLAADYGNSSGQCDLEACFADTSGGKWLAEHAYKYGFIIRYPENKTEVTGYQYEPWHLRYVGKETASKIHQSGKTMEEYYNLPPAPAY